MSIKFHSSAYSMHDYEERDSRAFAQEKRYKNY